MSSAAAFIADALLKGVFDVFDAMTAKEFSYSVNEDETAAPDFEALLANYPLVLRGRPKSGGAIALLLSIPDAAQLAALVEGTEQAPADIDEQAVLGVLREVAEPCLGAGLTNLLEKAHKNPEPLQGVQTDIFTAEDANALLDFFKSQPQAVPFSYSAESVEGSGYVFTTDELEQLVPQELRSNKEADLLESGVPNGRLSENEVNDILGGFGPGAGGFGQTAGAFGQPAQETINSAAEQRRGHSNLELVLDIRLVATARLGRIEMPIGDILALGPGSIIDVGRLVDEPVELLVNNKLIARGDVVVVDEKFGLRITEIISPKERIESMH